MLVFGFLAALAFMNGAGAAPIQVDSCAFVRSGSYGHSVQIRFRNTSSRTATIVAFDVHNGPHHITVRDHGSFAPNVVIEHLLATPTWELYHAEPHACIVTYVRFSDGTVWGE